MRTGCAASTAARRGWTASASRPARRTGKNAGGASWHRRGPRGEAEPAADRLGPLFLSGSGRLGESGDRSLCAFSAAPVAAAHASTAWPSHYPPARCVSQPDAGAGAAGAACPSPAVGEGVKSCPRAGCGKSARPVRGAGGGNGARVATAPPLDSTTLCSARRPGAPGGTLNTVGLRPSTLLTGGRRYKPADCVTDLRRGPAAAAAELSVPSPLL